MNRYTPSRRNTAAWLANSRELYDACFRTARAIKAAVDPPRRTGQYARSIEVRAARGWDGRVGAEVIATAPHSAAVEFGNRRTRGRGAHPLRTALRKVAQQ